MREESASQDRIGAGLRFWVESVTARTPEQVKSESSRMNRERRRRQFVAGGFVSAVVLATGVLLFLSGFSRLSPVDGSASPEGAPWSRPIGCSLGADAFVDEFVSLPNVSPALEQDLPPRSTLSFASGAAFGEDGLVRVLSVDKGTVVLDQTLDALQSSGRFKVFVLERCGSLASIAATAESFRSVISTAGRNSHLATVSISLDERRGLVILTGPRVIADELVAEARVDAALIDFASSVSSAD